MRHSEWFALLVPLLLIVMVGCAPVTPAPKITLYYEENAQVELTSPQGTRVLTDVYNDVEGFLYGPAPGADWPL